MSGTNAIIADLEYCFEQGDIGQWSDLDWMNWAAATEPQKLRVILDRLDTGLHGEDAIDVMESAAGFLRHRIDVLEKAMTKVVSYDDLLRRFEGPAQDTLFAGDVPVIDAAYDEMVVAAREALGACQEA